MVFLIILTENIDIDLQNKISLFKNVTKIQIKRGENCKFRNFYYSLVVSFQWVIMNYNAWTILIQIQEMIFRSVYKYFIVST